MSKLLKRLVIDSATKYLYISLHDGSAMIGKFYEAGNNDHSVKLMREIEIIMHQNNLTIGDLDEIIIGIGPGSYTGLRIGVTIAKIFGWNDNITVKSISSLALLASSYVLFYRYS
ncbi:MAG: tRNA (adenosine(37)-N6)-threonylcarbamoyltransferase complex dimerization subunit type 1 TsaB, partial [Candidatus Izemoplasma sp.]